MHACHLIVAFVLMLALGVHAQAGPSITLFAPGIIYECQSTTFSWTGGSPKFSFYQAIGYGSLGDDANAGDDVLVGTTADNAISFSAPPTGHPYRFKVQDSNGQVSQIWSEISQSNSCSPPTATVPYATQTATTTGGATLTQPVTTTKGPSLTLTWYSSSPQTPPTTPPASPPPFETVTVHPTLSVGPGTTTVKPAPGILPSPTPVNPSNTPAEPNPSSPANPTAGGGGSSGSGNSTGGDSSGGPSGSDGSPDPTGSSGISGPGENNGSAGGNPSGGTVTNNQTSRQGTAGQNPTQTASPLRNTTDGEQPKSGMSSQAIAAVAGTITGAFLLFVAFLCFRWRQRHQKKHRPAAILPRSSGNDLMTEASPQPYQVPPPMQPSAFYPSVPISPARVLPTSKEARFIAPPRRSSSSIESNGTPPSSLGAGTWDTSQRATSRRDSHSIYPEDEQPVASTSHAGQNLQPTAAALRPPLSLQELIGRELDNILSSPDTYSPDSPLYTPSSLHGRDPRLGIRIANATEASSSSGGALTSSSSKRPLETSSSHSHGRRTDQQRAGTPPDGSSARVAISRGEMEYLADLVAARITAGAHDSRTEQNRSDVDRNQHGHGPPPSYV